MQIRKQGDLFFNFVFVFYLFIFRTLDLHWSADGEAKDGAVPVQLIGGRTSLHFAAEHGYFDLCSLLIKYCAEPLVITPSPYLSPLFILSKY